MIYDFTMILLWFHYDQIYEFNMIYDFTMISLWSNLWFQYDFNMVFDLKKCTKNINKQKLSHIKTKLKS